MPAARLTTSAFLADRDAEIGRLSELARDPSRLVGDTPLGAVAPTREPKQKRRKKLTRCECGGPASWRSYRITCPEPGCEGHHPNLPTLGDVKDQMGADSDLMDYYQKQVLQLRGEMDGMQARMAAMERVIASRLGPEFVPDTGGTAAAPRWTMADLAEQGRDLK